MITLDEQAYDAEAPLDAWLELAALAQAQGLLAAPRTCAGSFVLSPLLVYARGAKGGEFTTVQAHFSARPAVFAVIPVRLPVGTTSITVQLTADLWSNGTGGLAVQLGASLLGVSGLQPILGVGVTTGAAARAIILTVPLPDGGLLQERSDTLLLWMRSVRAPSAWFSNTSTVRNFRTSGIDLSSIMNVGVFFGPDDLIEPLIVDDSPVPPSDGYEVQNAVDNQISDGFYRTIRYYPGGPSGFYGYYQVKSLGGITPRAVSVAINVSPVARARALHRANIPVAGQAHALLYTLAKAAQDAPRLLAVTPLGDVVGQDDEVTEPRKWRLTHGGARTVMSGSVWLDRNYGELELQLRVIGLDAGTVTGDAPDYSAPTATLEDLPITVELYTLAGGLTPSTSTPVVEGASDVTLDVWQPRSSSAGGRALADLGRYAEGRVQQRLTEHPETLSGPGSRDGLLLPEELALLSTWAFRVPVPEGLDITRPLGLQVRLDDTPFWTEYPDLLIAVVGASVTWDGRSAP